MNQLILGDNLEIMREMEKNSVDLIYLDPPFFSNRTYEVIWGDKGEIRSFEDRWVGGIHNFLSWLKERVHEMHRILKPTGSIYLHCDWHAAAYIKVAVLDKVFKMYNFRNEIIWHYRRWTAGDKQFQKMHDTIWFYSKTDDYTFNIPYEPYGDWIKKDYNYIDEETGKRWHTVKGVRYKVFLDDEKKGVKCNDVWQIPYIGSTAKERIGYPTQKPEKLLERIILASSNEGDVVLDPFVGGGTTLAVADKLNRRWIGIDQSVHTIKVTEMRLNKQQGLYSAPFTVRLHKYDYDTLKNKDAFEFEKWIIEKIGGTANIKQKGDLGIDGRKKDGIPIQVKRSENVGRNVVDNFKSACERYDNTIFEKRKNQNTSVGVIIAFSFSKGAYNEAARLKNEENTIIELITVDSIIPISVKPPIKINIEDIGFDKKGNKRIKFTASNGENLAFYSWDFNYDEESNKFSPSIMRDLAGEQVHTFKAGNYAIAVKAVDNEGLETIEVVKIKINGELMINDEKEELEQRIQRGFA